MKFTVYFQDLEKIWSPFSRLYYSQSSNCIISNYPSEVLEEIISSYCTQCVARFQDEEIQHLTPHFPTLTQSMRGYCPNCYQCKECMGVMIKYEAEGEENPTQRFFLVCTNCQNKTSVDLEVDKRRINARNHYFQTILQHYVQKTDPFNALPVKHKTTPSVDRRAQWHIDDVESELEKKRFQNANFSIPCPDVDKDLCLKTEPTSYQNFHLQNKRTLRSRKDFDDGKMNIVIQQKLLPLEGDSSMKLNKGKWWVKDSSAVHFLPSIHVVSLRLDELAQHSYIIVKVLNPTEFEAKITFRSFEGASIPVNSLKQSDLGQFSTFSLERFWNIRDSTAYGTIQLDPFEDELLKDISEEEDQMKILKHLAPKVVEDTAVSSSKVVSNIAYVRLPLKYVGGEHNFADRLHASVLFSCTWIVRDGPPLKLNSMIEISK